MCSLGRYLLRLLGRVERFERLVGLAPALTERVGSGGAVGWGSVSSGAGGGVVSIVQPIQPAITRTRSTKSRTGIPMAHCCQVPVGSKPNGLEKKAAR